MYCIGSVKPTSCVVLKMLFIFHGLVAGIDGKQCYTCSIKGACEIFCLQMELVGNYSLLLAMLKQVYELELVGVA